MVEKIINSHSSIIFLSGNMPDRNIMRHINTKGILIAADGAAKKISNLSLDYIIGDLDSSGDIENSKAKILKISDQNYTDAEKCFLFVKKQKLLPCLVLGANGGEIDHIFGNVLAILKHFENNEVYFLDTYVKNDKTIGVKLGLVLTKDKIRLQLKFKSNISIIPSNNTKITTKGLKWELNNQKLDINGTLAIRNTNVAEFVEFEIVTGRALIILDITEFFR